MLLVKRSLTALPAVADHKQTGALHKLGAINAHDGALCYGWLEVSNC